MIIVFILRIRCATPTLLSVNLLSASFHRNKPVVSQSQIPFLTLKPLDHILLGLHALL